MIELKLSDDQVQAMAATAIAAAIGPEQREQLIAAALKDLMTKKDQRYGQPYSSPLHDAFTRAMSRKAEELAIEMVEQDPELLDKVRAILAKAIERALVTNEEDVVAKLTTGITSALFKLDEKW